MNPEMTDISLRSLRGWKGGGAIGVMYTQEDRDEALRLEIPFVSMSTSDAPNICYVRADHRKIGQLAGEHLRSCGFEHFAFYGITKSLYAQERLRGFREAVGPHVCHVFTAGNDARATHSLENVSHDLREWLANLPMPVGVFAVNDARARAVADACQEAGVSIPDEVAIVGVDDNEVMCEFGSPTLTSIPGNRELIGYRAAEQLHRIINGEAIELDTVVPPGEIVARESTDIGIFSNPHTTTAHRYVRDRIHEPFGAEQLAEHVGISRRRLEQCVKEATGQTPYEFICSLRVEHAKQLIRDNEMKLSEVAKACGFRDSRHMRKVFAKFVGQTPSQFRQALVRGSASQDVDVDTELANML